MSEQQSQQTSPTVQATTTSACPHPDAVGTRWGDPISEERRATLQYYLDRWENEAERGDRKGPFDAVNLTGADVYWLSELQRSNQHSAVSAPNGLHLEGATLTAAHLENARLGGLRSDFSIIYQAHLEGSNLDYAHLEGSNLDYARLEGASLIGTNLEGASLSDAYLEGCILIGVHLERAFLVRSHMEGSLLDKARLESASLSDAHMEGVRLTEAHLEGARLVNARLEGASLSGVHLEGASLSNAHLKGTDLHAASFDKATRLNDVVLTGASFDQASFDNTNLTVVDWSLVTILGDECTARTRNAKDGKPKTREKRLEEYKAAVRANRVLSVTLRSQGMNEDADRYAYRAQLLRRRVLRLQGRRAASAFSWLLDLISGYGYEPVRSVIAYVAIILFFAGLYLLNSQFAVPHLRWDEALVLSISSFHGRGFFTTGIGLGDNLARLAAGEAIVGLLIEITFIATFTQRFFAR